MPGSSGEKTEKPTPKRREDERKEGNIFQSKEIAIAASLIVVFYGFDFLYPYFEAKIQGSFEYSMGLVSGMEVLDASGLQGILIQALFAFGFVVLPVALLASLVAIITGFAQTRLLVSFKSMKPKFSRMNPIAGIKKLFSLRGFIELLKSLIKIIVLFYIIYNNLMSNKNTLPKLFDMEMMPVMKFTGSVIMDIVKDVAIAFAFLAFFDYLYQRFEYEKNLKMTKQEVKEEYKNTEGDPLIKNQIKQRQYAAARRRMMQAVPEANVVIRNPTHYAVALKYEQGTNRAPVVVAKGVDFVAMKIVEIAAENNIQMTESPALARALYADVELNQEIPQKYYHAVAEVLAYIYKLARGENPEKPKG